MTEKNNKLLEALSQFQGDNITAKKTAKNPFHKSEYAPIDEIIKAVNHGAKYGLSFSQSMDYEITEHGTIQFVRTNVYHKDCDNVLTSRCVISVKGNKFDDSHAVGSAITYARRYSLSAIYGLATEDDDDGNANAKKPKGNSAATYLDNDGIEGNIADDAPVYNVPTKVAPDGKWTKKAKEYLEHFQRMDVQTDYEQYKDIAKEKMNEKDFKDLVGFVGLNNLREQDPYKTCLDEAERIRLELKEAKAYENAKGL